MKYGVIVHGGAGEIPESLADEHKKGVIQACNIAFNILKEGGSCIDAAESAVICLENNPVFDAGTGSFFTSEGKIEMDAMIATDTDVLGSVCGLHNIKNPIRVARMVAERTSHHLLVGDGAFNFARTQGLPEIPTEEFGVSPELILRYGTKEFEVMKHEFERQNKEKKEKKFGTVGCVCIDKFGHIAIGTSTGGSAMKLPGRVGDTAIWGAGGYINKFGGAAATGDGEKLLRYLFCYNAIENLSKMMTPMKSAQKALQSLESSTQGEGGIIILSPNGFGYAFNTPKMSIAFQDDTSKTPTVHFSKGIE